MPVRDLRRENSRRGKLDPEYDQVAGAAAHTDAQASRRGAITARLAAGTRAPLWRSRVLLGAGAPGPDRNPAEVLFAVASVLIIYWLVHVCVEALADRLITPSCGRRPGWARALRTEVSIIWGGVPALVVMGVSFLLGAPVQRATTLAQSVTVALRAVAGISVATARAEWDGGW